MQSPPEEVAKVQKASRTIGLEKPIKALADKLNKADMQIITEHSKRQQLLQPVASIALLEN